MRMAWYDVFYHSVTVAGRPSAPVIRCYAGGGNGLLYNSFDITPFGGGVLDKRVKTAITVAVLVPLLVFSAYTAYSLNGDSFDFSDSEMRIIITGSMDADPQPYKISTIPVNSVVIIRHMSYDEVANDLEIGDVIAFNYGGRVITHRVVAIDDSLRTITTKGDANQGTETISYNSVIGEVVGVNHWLGMAVHILRNYTISVILGTVGLVSGIIAVQSSLKIIREEREEDDAKASSGSADDKP